jgi:hypothetical protein
MSKTWRLAAFVSITALALFAAVSASADNPNTTYTCTKVKHNGDTDVQVNVPDSAVGGLTNAGYACVANEDEGQGGPTGDPGDGQFGIQGNENTGSSGGGPASFSISEAPQESRSLYCLIAGKTAPADWQGMGRALNLFDSQGEFLVQMGVVTSARFYQGLGASCDVLPGYTYSGTWVDHVGNVVPGVAVYPLYVSG